MCEVSIVLCVLMKTVTMAHIQIENVSVNKKQINIPLFIYRTRQPTDRSS